MVITYANTLDEFQTQRDRSSPIYGVSNTNTITNTLNYIISQTKKGIFIKIYDNRIVNFIVFNVRNNVENSWGDRIICDPKYFASMSSFLHHVAKKTRAAFSEDFIELNTKLWRCNNGLLRYEKPEVDNRKNVECIYDMFINLCLHNKIQNVEFFVNKRDFPLKRIGNFEPFHHIWDSKRAPLKEHCYNEYAPILSQCTESDFCDIPIPTFDDWARACEFEDGTRFQDSRLGKIFVPVDWKKKKNMAVFRGSSTGIGTTSKNNVRMKLVKMCEKFPSLFDVGFTRINFRPRKQYKNPYIQTVEEHFKLVSPLSLQEQIQYKLIINVEGHSAAFRLSSELVSGSCVILVESKWILWLKEFIKPYVHFVPVKSDLSDLVTQTRWCLDNDEKCFEISQNAAKLSYSLLSKRGMLEYLQNILNGWRKSACYSPRPVYSFSQTAVSDALSSIKVPGLVLNSAGDALNTQESKVLFCLTVLHSNEKYKLNFNNSVIGFSETRKKRCLTFTIEGSFYQLWTNLIVHRASCKDTSFIIDDLWYGPLKYTPLSDLKFLNFEFSPNIEGLIQWCKKCNIILRQDFCFARYDNRLFQTPIFSTNNSFLLSYYCIETLKFIPKSVQNNQNEKDPVWRRWNTTFDFIKNIFAINSPKTTASSIKFAIYSFPIQDSSTTKLVDYSKWNINIKNVLQHNGLFKLSDEDKQTYSNLFKPLFCVPEDYSFLVASHNATITF
jgi:hypothetical protein